MNSLSKRDLPSKVLLNRTAFLAAICLFFSTLEYLFPRPVPFFRLGLANLPIILSLEILPLPYLLLLALLKVLGQGLINGTLASYVILFSFSGTFVSLFIMYLAKKIPKISFVGISIIGAIFSNAAQVSLSIFIIFGENAYYIIPYFFTLALLTGTVMGLFANWFSFNSQWYHAFKNNLPFKSKSKSTVPAQNNLLRNRRKDLLSMLIPPMWRFILGLMLLLPLFFQENLLLKLLHILFLAILCRYAGKNISYFYFINLIFWITLFQLLSPMGEILLDLKIITITRGSLEIGLHKALLLIGLVFTSLFSVSKGLQLPGKLGGVLAKMFYFYEKLYNGRKKVKRRTFIEDVDQLLAETENSIFDKQGRESDKIVFNGSSKKKAMFYCIVILVLFYSLFIFGFFVQ